MQGRIDQLSAALNQLSKYGCAIVSLCINDNGNNIEILPPLDANVQKKLNGYVITLFGDNDGRHYELQARLNGCNVRWKLPLSTN